MSLSSQQGDSNGQNESMDFIETAQYNAPSGNSSRALLPPPWRQYRHPNGDIYYYNPQLRLITPDNIRDPQIFEYILDAREDHLQCLAGDPNLHRLPSDYELVISDISDTAAVIRMYSRAAGEAYTWTEEQGLIRKTTEHFWSYVAEYPSHHENLPPNTEEEFVQSLSNARQAVISGAVFPFSERQIEQIIARYNYLTGLRSQGRNSTPSLAWLVGAVMPLDAVGRRVDDQDLEALMNGSSS
ncbi:hypothetical protein CPB84DRAFT_1816638 [Gymnopilus junonius]|uniref:WW domain-containing protein n=1 Tax=Gymnopilus junonius TaxID=109634 RepID=A0A9P5NFA8_GYMJU|nr:hypothetical protein CPB84DRAFT_1816638 [Gymnopilus junonius]